MTSPLVPEEPFPTLHAGHVRHAAKALREIAADLTTAAAAAGRTAAQVTPVWQSRPSAPRAVARLDAVADVARDVAKRYERAATAAERFAKALEEGQQAAREIKARWAAMPGSTTTGRPLILSLPSVGSDPYLWDSPQHSLVQAALAADKTAAAQIRTEITATPIVRTRIVVADRASGGSSSELATQLRTALTANHAEPIEEVLRTLGRAKNEPTVLESVLATLTPGQQQTLAAIVKADPELAVIAVGIVGVLTADKRRVPAPLRTIKSEAEGTYVVQAGDTLSRLADWHGVPQAELVRLNPSLAADPDALPAGFRLKTG